MLARPYLCYGCRSDHLTLPDKCNWCGESVFLNLDYAGFETDMYPAPESVKKQLREEYDSKNRKPEPSKAKPTEELNVFAGFAPDDDHDSDVDFYGGLEHDAFLIGGFRSYEGRYEITAIAKTGKAQHLPCLVVVTDYTTNEVITKYRGAFHREAGYVSGKVCYATDAIAYQSLGPANIQIFCDLKERGIDFVDVDWRLVEVQR